MKFKLFFTTIILGVAGIFGMSQVSAEENYKWDEISTKFIEFAKEDGVTITKTDSEIKISLTNNKYGAYSMKMSYADNKLNYVNEREITAADDETKIYYADNDVYFLSLIICSMIDAYQIDPVLINDEGGFFSNGVTVNYGREIEISKEENGATETRTASPVNSFTVDFKAFSEETNDVQNTLEPEDADNINKLVTMFKILLDPMSESIWVFTGSISDEVENEIDKMDSGQTTSNKNITNNKNTVNDKTNEKNPQTGFELPIVLIGVLALLIGALFAVKKKNLFQNI